MKKSYSLFYVPEKPDFEIFSKEINQEAFMESSVEFKTEITEDELELQIVLKKDEDEKIVAFGFPQMAAYNPELSEDLYKILELKQVVLVVNDGEKYTFELKEENIEDIKKFMGLA